MNLQNERNVMFDRVFENKNGKYHFEMSDGSLSLVKEPNKNNISYKSKNYEDLIVTKIFNHKQSGYVNNGHDTYKYDLLTASIREITCTDYKNSNYTELHSKLFTCILGLELNISEEAFFDYEKYFSWENSTNPYIYEELKKMNVQEISNLLKNIEQDVKLLISDEQYNNETFLAEWYEPNKECWYQSQKFDDYEIKTIWDSIVIDEKSIQEDLKNHEAGIEFANEEIKIAYIGIESTNGNNMDEANWYKNELIQYRHSLNKKIQHIKNYEFLQYDNNNKIFIGAKVNEINSINLANKKYYEEKLKQIENYQNKNKSSIKNSITKKLFNKKTKNDNLIKEVTSFKNKDNEKQSKIKFNLK